MASAAVRFINGTKASPLGAIQLRLRVKPGASKTREGLTLINDDAVELCVAAQPRDGEANSAVVRVLSEALGVPKSSLRLTHGSKSREKTVLLEGVEGDGQTYARRILQLLREKAGG